MMNIRETSKHTIAWAILLVLFVGVMLPINAHAAPPPVISAVEGCNTTLGLDFDDWEYTSKVVGCLRGMIVLAAAHPTDGLAYHLSVYMVPTVTIMIALAIIIFGVRLLGGERDLMPKAIKFLLRLGLVWLFSFNLAGLGAVLFDIMDEMICMVSVDSVEGILSEQMAMEGILPTTIELQTSGAILNECYPWNFMDHFIGKLFGFGEHILLTHGLAGIIAGALFSSTAGILVFFTGIAAMLDVILMILRIVFIYLSAVLIVGFMIIISPLIIPLAIFATQERYFNRWLDILLTAMFTPMILFGFLSVFLGVYEMLIDRIVNILGGVDAEGKTHFDAYWRTNEPKFSWLMSTDPNTAQDFEDMASAEDVGSPAVQSFINPFARRSMDTNLFVPPGVDFGEAGIKVMQQLTLGFISLWIFSSLMKSMIRKIPEITQSIVGASLGITYQANSFEAGLKRGLMNARDTLSSGGGNMFNNTTRRRG
ncbi:MAG: type IV secretion system protein [Rickettsiales bacterium]